MRHENTVRTYSLLTSIINIAFEKSAKTKTTMQTKKFDLFTIVENEEGKFNILLGNALICAKTFTTLTNAINYLKQKPYEIIINTIMFIIDNRDKLFNNKDNNAEHGERQQSQN